MAHRTISETDWKTWRRLREKALERYCRAVLQDAAAIQQEAATPHARYLDLYSLMQQRNQELREMFDNPRRSNAFFQIAAAVTAGILTPEELKQFGEETQHVTRLLTGSAT